MKRWFSKEPVVSTVVTAASVNILLGMLEGQTALACFGILIAGGAIAIRGWQQYRDPTPLPIHPPQRYLPDHPSRPPMPVAGLSPRQTSPRQHYTDDRSRPG